MRKPMPPPHTHLLAQATALLTSSRSLGSPCPVVSGRSLALGPQRCFFLFLSSEPPECSPLLPSFLPASPGLCSEGHSLCPTSETAGGGGTTLLLRELLVAGAVWLPAQRSHAGPSACTTALRGLPPPSVAHLHSSLHKGSLV